MATLIEFDNTDTNAILGNLDTIEIDTEVSAATVVVTDLGTAPNQQHNYLITLGVNGSSVLNVGNWADVVSAINSSGVLGDIFALNGSSLTHGQSALLNPAEGTNGAGQGALYVAAGAPTPPDPGVPVQIRQVSPITLPKRFCSRSVMCCGSPILNQKEIMYVFHVPRRTS